MAIPLLASLLGFGGMMYGANKLRGSMLDSVLGEEGYPQQGPMQPGQDRQMMGGSGLLGNPYDPATRARSAAHMSMLGMDSGAIDRTMQPYTPQVQDPTTMQQQFEYMQSLPPMQQQQLMDFRRAGAQNINIGQGGGILTTQEKQAAGLAPEGVYQRDAKGKISQVSSAKYTPAQNKAASYALRMVEANNEMERIEDSLTFDPTSIRQNIDDIGLPPMLANIIRSPEQRQYEQAKVNWGSANLRDESGAVLGADEMEQELRKYFPVYGDDAETIAQKKRARRVLEQGQISKSGGAYNELRDTLDLQELEQLRQEQGGL